MSRPKDDGREKAPIRSVLLASYENAHKRVTLWWADESFFVSEQWADSDRRFGERAFVQLQVLQFRNAAMARTEYDVACEGAELLEKFSAAGGAR